MGEVSDACARMDSGADALFRIDPVGVGPVAADPIVEPDGAGGDFRVVERPVIFLGAFREAGLRCPEDISLIGFDNLQFSEMTSPPLSSVSQSGFQMGTAAAQILIERVRGDDGPAKHIVLETVLKIRDSVAPPNRK